MQGADARLARIGGPQGIALRRAIARDLERLRAAPSVDLTGMALKLDQLAQSVDALPLLAEASARPAAAVRPAAGAVASPPPATTWSRLRAWLGQEFGDLVRIREVDTPEALLLNGPQQQLVRHQLKLRLLDARQALLMRSDPLYRADLTEAQALLVRYFDLRAPAAAGAQAQLKQLAGLPLSVDLPQVSDSLAALRGLRQGGR
jgi:uroporphyrin-3 C-methyltransferase/uroporphyrinogen III methyltransferase/synthase